MKTSGISVASFAHVVLLFPIHVSRVACLLGSVKMDGLKMSWFQPIGNQNAVCFL